MSPDQRTMNEGFGVGPYSGDTVDEPYFRVLSDRKLERIHEATVEVLGTIGIQVEGPEAVEMMGDASCEIEDDMVRVPRKLIEDAISSAPKQFVVYDRQGEPALHLGTSEVYARSGGTVLEYFDIDTGERKKFDFEQQRKAITVADALPHVDMVGQTGVVAPSEEAPLEVVNHLEVEIMLNHTTKPLWLLVASAPILEDCFEMAEAVVVANGGKALRDKPFLMPMLNPISPLLYNADTVDKLILSVDWGLPVVCGPMPMAGGTSPLSVASTIMQSNAESLFGLVMSQVRRKGAEYIMITYATALDMMTGEPARGPESHLAVSGCIEMGHYYGVPMSGGGLGFGGNGLLDAAAGLNHGIGGLARMLLKGNASIGLGGALSIESLVLADDTIDMLKAFMGGVQVDDETLAVDVLRDIGPGANTFLGHPHTFSHFRDLWRPGLIPRQRYEDWEADGSQATMDYAKQRARQILATHKPKPIPQAAQSKIAEVIARARDRVPVVA